MKIDLLIKGLGLGGAERHVVDLAVSLRQMGHDVLVAYLLPHKNALCEELDRNGVAVLCIGGKTRLAWPIYFARYVRFLRKRRPDVVHAHLPVPGLVARASRFFVRFSCVYTEHNMYRRLHPITRMLHRATRWIDDRAISCSTQVADSLPWKSHVVINGVSAVTEEPGSDTLIRDALGIPGDALVLISIANLLRKKNHALMIEAFSRMPSVVGQDVHLVLVGQDGTERGQLEELTQTYSLKGRVHFYGPHPNARSLLGDADIFCLSSDFEGLPIALLESMMAGMPAIVTDAGGMAEAVVSDGTGIVVPVGDVAAYAEAMHRLASSKELRERMGSLAKNRATDLYSREAMVNRLLGHYLAVLG